MLGNLLQQIYNITDTIIVGRVLGSGALAAVGSTYTLMTFLTSVMIGLCMGCGTLFSMHYGAGHQEKTERMHVGLLLADLCCHPRHVPHCLHRYRRDSESPADSGRHLPSDADIFPALYSLALALRFCTITCFVLRAVGNSVLPLIFLHLQSLNIALDLLVCHSDCISV